MLGSQESRLRRLWDDDDGSLRQARSGVSGGKFFVDGRIRVQTFSDRTATAATTIAATC